MNPPYTCDDADLLVRIAYQLILLREPDPVGASSTAANLLSQRIDLQSLFETLLRSPEFATMQSRFLHTYVEPQRRELLNDHSQNGEFKRILEFLMANGSKHKIIVDVGARGRERSNSYDVLMYFAWQGLLVEANPALIASIREEFAGANFLLEELAVSDYEGEADFFFGINEDISSLRRSAVAGWGEVNGKTTVQVRKLPAVLRKHHIPEDFDILSLDIEGEDIRVFNDLIDHSPFRPGLAVIEVGDAGDVHSLSARGFCARVENEYDIWDSCGPNLFLVKRR
jgi:FkbM family methyltransferase